jgi:flagellar L-ring protein precursor FlgH
MKKINPLHLLVACLITSAPLAGHYSWPYDIKHSPFTTYIAQKTGDLLTVLIQENSTTTDDGKADLIKNNTLQATLNDFFTPLFDPLRGLDNVKKEGSTPKIDLITKGEYKSLATNTSTHKFTTRLQVRMIEEVRDGEFMIRGHRTININGKAKKIFVSGIIRQRDISSSNTVDSNLVLDSTIEIEGEVSTKDLERSLITKIFQAIF